MPTYRNITVQVTDASNEALVEWGVHKRDRSRLATCYIQSKINMAFRIRIVPAKPFPRLNITSPDNERVMPADQNNTSKHAMEPSLNGHLRSPSTSSSSSTSSTSSSNSSLSKRWHLLATLRLDGRRSYEKRAIIYLDEDHRDYKRPNGEEIMKSRMVKDANGSLRECGWLFKDVGIDIMLEKLMLSVEHGEGVLPTRDDEDLLAALSQLDATLEDAEEKSTVGQIEVTFKRVTLGEKKYDQSHVLNRDDDDVNMATSDINRISHRAGRDAGEEKAGGIHTITYFPVEENEPPYATFKFYYRSEGNLRKLQFPGFPAKATLLVNSRRQREEALSKAAAAPLSILDPKPVRYLFNDNGEVIAEEDIPFIDLTEESTASVNEDSSKQKAWRPNDSKIPVITVRDDSPISLLDSPPDSPAPNEYSESTPTVHPAPKYLAVPTHLTLDEAEQSSADESSPFQPVEKRFNGAGRFRMIEDAATEGEDADDEASESGQTPNAMSILNDDDDNGIAQDKFDEGLGARLEKIQIGSKRVGGDDESTEGEHAASTTKRAKMGVQMSTQEQATGEL